MAGKRLNGKRKGMGRSCNLTTVGRIDDKLDWNCGLIDCSRWVCTLRCCGIPASFCGPFVAAMTLSHFYFIQTYNRLNSYFGYHLILINSHLYLTELKLLAICIAV
jgi:hypothetical protein